jgi:iron complex outermembrane receptor protein
MALVTALAYAIAPQSAHAQDNSKNPDPASGETIGEIVVTAQRRGENLQSTPLAITALDGNVLRQQQITDVSGIQALAPSVQIGTGYGGARISIRGIGSNNVNPGSETRVAYYLDGVYISRPEGVLGTFFDISRIEVLRGPQGTLYGRNAIAGTINVITGEPTSELDGFAQLTIGNYDLIQTEGAVGGPLTDTVSVRIAGSTADRDGYGENLFNGRSVNSLHSKGARLKLKFEPNASFSVRLAADYFRQRDSFGILQWARPQFAGQDPRDAVGYPDAIFGSDLSNDPQDQNVNVHPWEKKNLWGVSGTVRWKLNDHFAITSISAYRRTVFDQTWDNDGSQLNIDNSYQHTRSNQFTQELQLSGEFDKAHFIAGLYYFNEDQFGSTAVPLDRLIIGMSPLYNQGLYYDGTLKAKSFAAFGQLTYIFSPQLSVDLGLRYSHEKKEKINERYQFDVERAYDPANPVIPATILPYDSESQESFDPKLTINFKANSDILVYATYARGFKSGGFNLGGLQPPFDAEKVEDFEGGIKADLLGNRLRVNLSAFHYKYSNLQVTETLGQIQTVKNAAAAKLTGAELEVTAKPVRGVQLDFAGSVLRSKFTSFVTEDPARAGLGPLNLKGNHLPQAPRYTALLGVQYTLAAGPGDVTFRAEGNWVGQTYFSEYNLEQFGQKPYEMYNLYINFTPNGGRWNGSLFVKNVGDKIVVNSGNQASTLNGAALFGALSPPRTYGARLAYHF